MKPKHFTSVFVALLFIANIILANFNSATIIAFALSGNQIDDLITVAEGEVGFQGTNDMRNKYTLWCGQLDPSVYPVMDTVTNGVKLLSVTVPTMQV